MIPITPRRGQIGPVAVPSLHAQFEHFLHFFRLSRCHVRLAEVVQEGKTSKITDDAPYL